MDDLTYTPTEDERAALIDTAAQQAGGPSGAVSVEDYFRLRTRHWIAPLVQARVERIREQEAAAAAQTLAGYRTLLARGTDEDRALLARVEQRAQELARTQEVR